MIIPLLALAFATTPISVDQYVHWTSALERDPTALHPSMKFRMQESFTFTLDAVQHLNLLSVQFPTDCDEDTLAVRNISLTDLDRVVTVYAAEIPFTITDAYVGEMKAGRYELVYWMAGPTACRIDDAVFVMDVRAGPPPPPPPPPPPVLGPIDSEYALIKSWIGFDRGTAVELVMPDNEVTGGALFAGRLCFTRDPGAGLAMTHRPYDSSTTQPLPLTLVRDVGGADPRACSRTEPVTLHEHTTKMLKVAFGDHGKATFLVPPVREPYDERLVVRASAAGNLFGTTQWRTPRLTPMTVAGHLCANTTTPLANVVLVSPDGATRLPVQTTAFGAQCYELAGVELTATGIWKLEASFAISGTLSFPLVVEDN